ncbi:MAG: hypothetical protein PW734_04965 [Verrucomicrobium sp.]|nr:hypothetical protein [Verrucomicrobium sp.]
MEPKESRREALAEWAAVMADYAGQIVLREKAEADALADMEPELIQSSLRLKESLGLPDTRPFHEALEDTLSNASDPERITLEHLLNQIDQADLPARVRDARDYGRNLAGRIDALAQAGIESEADRDAAALKKATALQDFAVGNPTRHVGSLAAQVMERERNK